MTQPAAIAVLEFASVVVGTRAADAMAKKAPLDTFWVGTVHPGKYVVLIGGSVAAVDEAYIEGLRFGGECLSDQVMLPDVHPQVYGAVGGVRQPISGDTLGVIESDRLAATVVAADRAVKTADVTVIEIRLGDGLGGKGLIHLSGLMHDVQAAVEAGLAGGVRPGVAMCHTIIPVVDEVLRRSIDRSTRFDAESGA